MEDLPRFGRPSTSLTEVNIVKVKEMVTKNHHLTLREIAAEFSVSHESIRTVLNDCLSMKRVAVRQVPKDFFLFSKLKLPFGGTRFQPIFESDKINLDE